MPRFHGQRASSMFVASLLLLAPLACSGADAAREPSGQGGMATGGGLGGGSPAGGGGEIHAAGAGGSPQGGTAGDDGAGGEGGEPPAPGGGAMAGAAGGGGGSGGTIAATGGQPPPPPRPFEIPQGTGPFLAQDGLVVWEVESPAYDKSVPSGWELQTKDPGYEAEGYFRWVAPNSHNQPGKGTLTYRFTLEEDGLYRFAWRNMKNGAESDLNNDSFVEFPTAEGPDFYKRWFKTFGGGQNRFLWVTSGEPHGGYKGPICIFFKKGTHTMRVSGRSQGHAIDRIGLYKNANDQENYCRSRFLEHARLENTPPSPRAP